MNSHNSSTYLKLNSVTMFFVMLTMIIGSISVQRLNFLGNPDLSPFRVLGALFLMGCFFLLVLENKIHIAFKPLNLIWFMFACLWLGYTVFIGWIFGDGISTNIFYWLYALFVFWGYYVISRHLDLFNRYLITLMLVAGVMGILMFVAGAETIQNLGIGAYKEDAFGQFSTTDKQGTLEMALLFRSFSIFPDHQTFSSFLQLTSCYFRFCYQKNPSKHFILLSYLAFLFNLVTFSTTGLLVLSVVLFSYFRLRVILAITVAIACVLSFLAFENPELFFLFIHTSSLEARIMFIQRALDAISWIPHGPADSDATSAYHSSSGFSSDNIMLWLSYKYGLFFGVLNVFLFFTFIIKSLLLKKYRMALLVFAFVYCANNMLTNGTLISAVNNILFPVILGIILSHMFKKEEQK